LQTTPFKNFHKKKKKKKKNLVPKRVMSASSSRDLVLLERVELRLAHLGDDALTQFLAKFLPGVICIAGKPPPADPAARAAALRILTHVSKRLAGEPTARLPVNALARSFAGTDLPRGERSIALVYLRRGLARLNAPRCCVKEFRDSAPPTPLSFHYIFFFFFFYFFSNPPFQFFLTTSPPPVLNTSQRRLPGDPDQTSRVGCDPCRRGPARNPDRVARPP
jgi:hypothetical protein